MLPAPTPCPGLGGGCPSWSEALVLHMGSLGLKLGILSHRSTRQTRGISESAEIDSVCHLSSGGWEVGAL